MAEYRITGIWEDGGTITHYAVHTRTKNADGKGYSLGKGKKMTKVEAVKLLDQNGNSAKTYLWNYSTSEWYTGGNIEVVDATPKYLRTVHDGVTKNNLSHLPDFDYVW